MRHKKPPRSRRPSWLFSLLLVALLAIAAGPAEADWHGVGHVAGTVRDPDGRPIAGATVTLRRSADEGPPPATTDAKGHWSLGGLAGGSWKLRVEAKGFIAAEGTIPVGDAGPSPAADVQLRSLIEETPAGNENPQAVVLWLEKGNTLLEQGHTQEARREYEKALRVLPRERQPDVLQAVARTWFLEKNVDKAVAAIEDALRIEPKSATLRPMLHVLLDDQGRGKEADAFLATLDSGAASSTAAGSDPDAERGELPPQIAADVAAKPEAPQPGRPGAYKVAFPDAAPLTAFDEILRRTGNTRDEVLQLDPHAGDYDVRKETFQVRVPAGDAPAAGWGVLVWISPGPYGGTYRDETHAALDRHRLIWIGPNAADNTRPRWDRMRLALDAAWHVQRLYKVDPSRVYVGGYSGGSRISSALTLLFPDVFRGGLLQMGIDWYHDMPIPDRPGTHWPAWFQKPSRDLLAQARERRFVLLEGERDFNLTQSRLTVKELAKEGFTHVTLLEMPGATHYDSPSAEWLEKALSALDGG